jgi:hypothetical protein
MLKGKTMESTQGLDKEGNVQQKRLGLVIQEVTNEIRSWPAWAQPYRPATNSVTREPRPSRHKTRAQTHASRKRD